MDWLHIIWVENFQHFAADNLGRELTDVELNRLRLTLIDHNWHLDDLMYEAGKDAMDNTEGRWDSVDKNFKEGKPVFANLICKEL